MQITAYLGFDGNCAEAFRFYEKVLQGKIESIVRIGDSPAKDHSPPSSHDRVMNVTLTVGSACLMGADSPEGQFEKPQAFCVSVHDSDLASCERIFKELSEGGKVTMPWQATFWSPGFGMLVDKYDVPWIVNTIPASAA